MAEKTEEYRGKHIVVRFDGTQCIHSRNCVLGHPGAFVPNAEGPWIKPDAASADRVAAIAMSCPSGAITFERLDEGAQEIAPEVNVVRVRENGPLVFHADLNIEGQPARFRATLCRCGASKNKPYCDGSHSAAGFSATGEPSSEKSEPLSARNGTLRIKPRDNGPLLVEGPLEICAGSGRTIMRTTKTALCRCGQSSNKPYCDGTHNKTGFKT